MAERKSSPPGKSPYRARVGINFTHKRGELRFEIGEEITHPIPAAEAKELLEAGHIEENN